MTQENPLVISTPEAEGVRSSGILAFLDGIEAQGLELHSLMLLRHGKIIAQGWWNPYRASSPHMLFSLSKSFTSTAVGLAISEGLLSLDDTVISFFPDETPAEVSDNLAKMKVRHLINMCTGHAQDATGPGIDKDPQNWVRGFLSLPVEHEPGSLFVYNTLATYMLSAIGQKLTGETLLEYLRPRLFEPLGIENPTWETCPAGINTGGFGLSITTEDIARFGQLYLQKGMWNGQRLLPEGWVEEATARHIENNGDAPDWQQGYGYQFWRCQHGHYRGDGAFGQYCIVMPEQDAVLAITAGVGDMQAVLNNAWGCLLPAMHQHALPAALAKQASLEKRLANLAYKPPAGQTTADLEPSLTGKTYTFEPNDLGLEALTLTFQPSSITLDACIHGTSQKAMFRRGVWRMGSTLLFSNSTHGEPCSAPQPTAASAVWTSSDTLLLTLRHYETPFTYTLRARFSGDQVELAPKVNVSFGPTEMPTLVGKKS